MAGGRGRCWVGTVDDDARGSKQEIIQQLLNQRSTWGKSYMLSIKTPVLSIESSEHQDVDKNWIQEIYNWSKMGAGLYSYMYTSVYSPRCSFSLPQSESRVLMSRRCPARRMLSASLVSISELQLGSKLSSQEISSSSMVAALTCKTSISEAGWG